MFLCGSVIGSFTGTYRASVCEPLGEIRTVLRSHSDTVMCTDCKILLFYVQSCKQNQLGAQIFLIRLLLFSTCFGQLCAHHQDKITVSMGHLVFVTLYRVTNTRCRKGTVFYPDDGHIVARNMYRKAINVLRKSVHQIGSVYNKLYMDAGQQNIIFFYIRFVKTETISFYNRSSSGSF